MMSHSDSDADRRRLRPRSVILPPFEVDCSSWLADSVPPESGPFIQISRVYGPPEDDEGKPGASDHGTLMAGIFPIETESAAAEVNQWLDVVGSVLGRAVSEVRKMRADGPSQEPRTVALDTLEQLVRELNDARARINAGSG